MNSRLIGAVIAIVVIIVIAGVAVAVMSGGGKTTTTSTTSTTSASSTTSIIPTTSSTSSSTSVVVTTSSTTSSATSSKADSIIITNSTALGSFLANGTNWTFYLFTNDTRASGVSSCYGACATFWPAFHGNASTLVLPAGVNASAFGTIKRTDGTTQITYDG